jgi:hypothetical protein
MLALLAVSCATPQPHLRTEQALLRHITYLASDELAGRAPRTPRGPQAQA